MDVRPGAHIRDIYSSLKMKINWIDKVSNTRVLSGAGMATVSTLVMAAQPCWAGHIVRMPDGKLPMDIM